MFSDLSGGDDYNKDDELDDYLNFGKYKRKTIRAVMRDDPDYIDWACQEGIIALDDEAADFVEELKQNLAKSAQY